MTIGVVAVDIGSVRPPPKFAWAQGEVPGSVLTDSGNHPGAAIRALATSLAAGTPTALLLEAPMSVPVPAGADDSWVTLGRARCGEGDRPWSAGAGTSALATGLAQGSWLLQQLAAAVPGLPVTTQPAVWLDRGEGLLLAEAFITGKGKPVPVSGESQHVADASAAALALADLVGSGADLKTAVSCAPE